MKENKAPKVYLILKIIGFLMIAVGAVLIIVGLIQNVPSMGDDSWFNASTTRMGLIFGGLACCLFGIFLTITGFTPSIMKVQIKTQKHVINENADDLKNIADTGADIVSGGVGKIVKTVKDNIKDNKFCKFCGKEIDGESIYCPFCGKKQK